MVPSAHAWAPEPMRPLVEAALAAARSDPRIVGVTVGGSAATASMDEFSDLDLVLVCRDEDQAAALRDARAFASTLGPLLTCFTGEHVGEPRLLICLYGPPPLHVDLKFVADRDVDARVEDGLVLWQRDGALDRALARAPAAWPAVDPQWIEDRFWTWVHYAAAKIGRGELFECLDALALIRGTALGPLISAARGHRAAGVRRIEAIAPDLVPALATTVGDATAPGCLNALRATIALYRTLRADRPPPIRRAAAERAALEYFETVAVRA